MEQKILFVRSSNVYTGATTSATAGNHEEEVRHTRGENAGAAWGVRRSFASGGGDVDLEVAPVVGCTEGWSACGLDGNELVLHMSRG